MMWFSKEERERRKLQKEIERAEREEEEMLKELKRYADHFKKYLEYMDSLKKAETFRLPDDYPLPCEILPQHFPDMTGRCCFKGGWGYDAEHAAVLKSDQKIKSDENSDAAALESAFIEKRNREELFFARSEGQRFEEPSFKIVERTRREVNGIPYDHILADVSGQFIAY
ncbi:MAG: hypothetical protein IKO93_11740 [Lentisphaeria bacterium]|nr:hypothetical protein [Lentisphaeria bacterium]